MSNKPKIFGSCRAGCMWETVHMDDFLASATYFELSANEDGRYYLKRGKEYKIFSNKNSDNNFIFTINFVCRVNGVVSTYPISHTNNDKYAESVVFRLVATELNNNGLKLVYEIAGIRYEETISGSSITLPDEYLYVGNATRVLLYNSDAQIIASGFSLSYQEIKDEITFYLQREFFPDIIGTYKAEIGMTWNDWCFSEYSGDWTVVSNEILYVTSSGLIQYKIQNVAPTDKIEAATTYEYSNYENGGGGNSGDF